MHTSGKHARDVGRGLVLVGIVFAVGGAIWLLTGRYTTIGISHVTVGLVFIFMGMAAARKAARAPHATGLHAAGPHPSASLTTTDSRDPRRGG